MSDNDFQKIMQQAQQMQSNIQQAQEEITKLTVIGEAGAGLVKVQMNGRHDIKRVYIAPHLVGQGEQGKPEDVDKAMLEDLIAAAVNDAVRKVEKTSREKMAGLMSGMNLPPDMMPFGGGDGGQGN